MRAAESIQEKQKIMAQLEVRHLCTTGLWLCTAWGGLAVWHEGMLIVYGGQGVSVGQGLDME